MSEDTVASDTTTNDGFSDELALIEEAVAQIKEDAPKALAGNKKAAARARKALNEVKKLCTPLRIKIQEAIKTKKA